MPGSVILAGARTPIGKLSGALAAFSAAELGGFAVKAALERAGVAPDEVDYVFMGQVLQAGQGQITARQAAVAAGIPMSVPATTVNKVCLSGLNAVYLADQMIAAGDAEIVVAGGMESMTNAPYVLPGARAGFRLGDATLVDAMMFDGLTDAFDHDSMGLSTDRFATKAGISRDRQDSFAAASHERAASAIKEGRFALGHLPVEIHGHRAGPADQVAGQVAHRHLGQDARLGPSPADFGRRDQRLQVGNGGEEGGSNVCHLSHSRRLAPVFNQSGGRTCPDP